MSIKLLNEKRMDELIQFIHQEEITKEYLKQNQKIIYINENQNINGVIIFDVIKNEIELCLGTDEIKQQLIAVIKKIALKDIVYQNKIIQIKTKKQFKHYEEVYDFIHQQKDRVYSLDNFKKYMQEFYNIQHALKCIHVCGTNGKGSTVNYMKEVLKKQGYIVGTFTSPALISRLDVVRINDEWIKEQFIVDVANRYVDNWLKYEISLFEIEVFISILYFIYQGVDYAIYEVGLGGELDATNIILPMVCVNTNIGLDHMDYLGDSYESIARAKAGIIKDHVDFITGEHKQECVDIFRDTCEKRHSHLIRLDRIHDLQDGENVKYTYKDYNIVLNTPALYQIENSALALETLLYLKKHHFIELDESSIVEGLFEAKWAGRFEIISEKPLIILDGAHNREGVDELYRSARKLHNLKIIFSALRDKDTDYMIERLLESSAIAEENSEEPDESADDMKLTSLTSISDFLNCAGSTLPENIRLWARRNLVVARSSEVTPEEKRHAQRALSIMLNIKWKSNYFESIDPVEARRILDEELFGMESVKQRIIETVIQINRTHTLPAYGILLVGPAGTGKSQIAYLVAKILKMPWTTLDMSSINDAEQLTGSSRIYSNAKPGIIMEAFNMAGESNLVFIINELDKATSSNGNANPADVLLTLLDNLGFTDNYMECLIPTSGVYPIATANDKDKISAPLLSRFAVIDIPDYTREEKKTIFLKYSLPKVLKRIGLHEDECLVLDDGLDAVLDYCKDTTGIRDLEQAAEHLAAHALYMIEVEHATSVSYTADMVNELF